MLLRVIVATDDADLRSRLCDLLKQPNNIVEQLQSERFQMEQLGRNGGDVLIVGQSLLTEPLEDAVALLCNLPESPAVIVTSEDAGGENVARLLAAGCEAVLYSGLPREDLLHALDTILARRRETLDGRLAAHRQSHEPRLSDYVSESPAMRAFLDVVEPLVKTDVALLIEGEIGIGKERLARAIHAGSPRSEGPFVVVNCGELSGSACEIEMFGHEKGAFSGASRARRGTFEMAHGGTIFLNEVSDIPENLQGDILGLLRDHTVHRVGGEQDLLVDVRVMAATSRNIGEEVERGEFRRDLYYRLGVVTLTIPPLRDRREDIPGIIDRHIANFRSQIDRGASGIEDEALEAVAAYDWPGNERELVNVIERAMLLCEYESIALKCLPASIARLSPSGSAGQIADSLFSVNGDSVDGWLERTMAEVRREVLDRFERAYLTVVLRAAHGRVGAAAKRAGITPRHLFNQMKRHDLRKEDFRPAKRKTKTQSSIL